MGLGEGAPHEAEACALGCLREHDALARDSGGDDGTVGGPLDLLNGVEGGEADDGSSMADDSVDGAFDEGGLDEGADSVMDEDDVIVLAIEGLKGVGDGVLAVIATGDDGHPFFQMELGDLGGDAIHLLRAHGYVDAADAGDGGEGAEGEDEDGRATDREELLGRRRGDAARCHTCADARGWKNTKDSHQQRSIPTRGRVAAARPRGVSGGARAGVYPALPVVGDSGGVDGGSESVGEEVDPALVLEVDEPNVDVLAGAKVKTGRVGDDEGIVAVDEGAIGVVGEVAVADHAGDIGIEALEGEGEAGSGGDGKLLDAVIFKQVAAAGVEAEVGEEVVGSVDGDGSCFVAGVVGMADGAGGANLPFPGWIVEGRGCAERLIPLSGGGNTAQEGGCGEKEEGERFHERAPGVLPGRRFPSERIRR